MLTNKTYTKEEQKAHRAELVAALRSGKYTQTMNVLHNTTGFCCLGVACDLAGVEWKPHPEAIGIFVDDTETNHTTLPTSVKMYFGFQVSNGTFRDAEGKNQSLSSLNDTGSTFEEIAAIIEAEPTGLIY